MESKEDLHDLPELSSEDDDGDDGDDDDDGWKEMESDETLDRCLFCQEKFGDTNKALAHCKTEHKFDLSVLKVKHDMDFYSYIKLIGFIRTAEPDPASLMAAPRPIWDDDKFLKPVFQENWLMFDFDSLNEGLSQTTSFHANVENGLVTLSETHFIELQKTIQSLSGKVKEKNDQLEAITENMVRMQKVMQSIISNDSPVRRDDKISVGMMDLEEDSGYFGTYAHFSIHHDMLSDVVRTDSYKNAILNNKEIFTNNVAMDLGCGTGILSMFSSLAGASKVFAIDQSDIIYHAMDIIRENEFTDKIVTIKGRVEDIRLPEKVDIIVSEWMGYFLLFEGMLDSVIYARDNCLKPNGILMPNRCTISIVGSGDMDTHSKLIGFWSDVYGFKMNCMRGEVIKEASIDVANSSHIITSPNVICDINMYTCTTESVNFSSELNLEILKDGNLAFFVGYFDTFFDLPNPVSFSTGPESTTTHWKQTIFYLKEPIPVKKGTRLQGKLVCNRNVSDIRGLIVNITILNKTYKYILN